MATYLDEVKKLADTKRDTQMEQAKLLEANAFKLSDDPTKTRGPPTPLKPVPFFNFAPLENAVARVGASAKAYDAALAAKGASPVGRDEEQAHRPAGQTEQALTLETGLPGGRDWYKNMIYAPGRFTGYGAKTLPGVREAIEDERWDDADTYSELTASALNAYADKLDEGVALMGGLANSARSNAK